MIERWGFLAIIRDQMKGANITNSQRQIYTPLVYLYASGVLVEDPGL